MSSATVPITKGMDFAVGVDTPSGEARNTAVTGSPSPIPGAGGSIADFQMHQIETVDDLMDSLGISASASGGCGLFSASARLDFAKNCHVHSSSVFVFVAVTVTLAFQSIKQPGISDTAGALLSNGQTDRFQAQFGDMFVRGIQTGGQFVGLIEVITRDETDKQSVSVGLQGSYTAFKVSGEFDQTFTQTVTSHQTTVRCHIEGGQDSPIPVQIDEMMDAATKFPGTVPGNAIPYTALLDSYSILPIPDPPNFIDLQQQKDVLTRCATLRNQDLMLLNEIGYIASHPAEFPGAGNFNLNQIANDLNADLDTVAAAASVALNNPKNATLPTDLKVAAPPPLPTRLAGALVTVPDLIGQDFDTVAAQNPIFAPQTGALGLTQHDNPLSLNHTIVRMTPPPGSIVPQGTVIDCLVGSALHITKL